MNENVAFPPSEPTGAQRPEKKRPPAGEPVLVNDTTRTTRPRSGEFNAWKAFQSVFSVALLVATLFTLWTPANLFSNNLMDRMFQAVQPREQMQNLPTPTNSPRLHIGLVAGHWGNDSGSVCDDGLTEMEVNLKIATLVKEKLMQAGYEVDLLKEFDPKLTEYKALALISVHNDSCQYVNDEATGFKVAAAASSIFPEKSTRLTACLSQRYKAITGMSFHYNTVTRDMTEYHAFNEIHSDTTAAIIETGFLNLDREILTKRTDQVAQGVASGILCFVRNEDVPQSPVFEPTVQETAEPTATP